jgi:serine/threonine protein kinase/Flp pilus assembly protein TadD
MVQDAGRSEPGATDARIGRRLLHYEIVEKLGEGGMGVVYKARDLRLQRFVALKLLPWADAANPARRERFLREARAASALSHPHIITVHDIASEDGADFIVMEYVDGQPLDRIIPRRGLPLRDALGYALQIADAIAAAHNIGLIHRDLKPGNVVVAASGRLRVLDFGLAKLTEPEGAADAETVAPLTAAGVILGTPAYMAPEQAIGESMDHRADLFSLGVVLYEMVTGVRPFQGANHAAIIHALLTADPQPVSVVHPGMPAAVDEVINRALAKNPADRYPNAEALMADLRALLTRIDSSVETHVLEARTAEVPRAASPRTGVASEAGAPRPPSVGSERASIAVLPFATLSSDKEDEYIAGGITAELISALSGVPDLRVASHLASFRFKDTPDLQKVADSLNIRYVLTGSLRRAGPRIRVTAELTEASAGLQLWAKTYQRAIEDVFDVQEEIAREIVNATGGQLIRAGSERASRTPPESLDAWGLVRRAYHFWNHAFSLEGVNDALNLLRRAVQLDPNYAAARAFLGLYLIQRVVQFISPEPSKDAAEALESAERAIDLAPRDPEVLENAGLVYFNTGQYQNAVAALTRAVDIAPFNLVAWGYLACAHVWSGDDGKAHEGLRILERLLTTAPDHPSVPYWLYFKSEGCIRAQRYADACEAAEKSVSLQPYFFLTRIALANALGGVGNLVQGRTEIDRVLAINPLITPEGYEGAVRLLSHSREHAERHLAGLRAIGWMH